MTSNTILGFFAKFSREKILKENLEKSPRKEIIGYRSSKGD